MDEDLLTALSDLLAKLVPDFQSLQSCEQLTAGASQETYRIDLNTQKGAQKLALRRAQPSATQNSSLGGVSLGTEAKLLTLAVNAGIPGPKVLHVLQPEDKLGSGFIMQWLEGETLGQRINRAEELQEVRPRLARQCGQILGRIHGLDWSSAGLEGHLPCVDPKVLVEETWRHYRDLNVPVPMIDYSWRWLQTHPPEASRTTLVHGDFRNGNLMITPSGIRGVLDWELAHLGDPVRDLGWLCVNSWRFGHRDLPVGGFGHKEELLEGYAETSGETVDPDALHFWQVFGSFWWSVVTLQMAQTWRTGETPSLERPVIGRRSSEAQMDCVNLLIPGDYHPPEPISQNVGTQLPMPTELLDGVVEFLKRELAPQLDAHNHFLARVAANSLSITRRYLAQGPAAERAEMARLQALLDDGGDLDSLRWALVNRLREGPALDTHELTDHLRQTVADQLAIDQPTYSALK
ncbi:MAG: phosphotransferase family protein [Pseudomonadota bacterium]